ncbi:MAG: helicase-related protein, partial [Planctomycetota bacterium]|nr:helicase-related protein [Planctomycetota bacterium]
ATARQIADDMSLGRPMDRLVCGDVGYGKTELAMRAAFCVTEGGRQVAILVPTTVLAAQHHRTLSERFADYPVRIEVLSRFQTARQQAETIKKLALKQVDIVVGTHRILSKDVKFADLGLAVIDEEQRFGVAHKEHLKTLRSSVEVLTMTATPIPRTLHMALLGLRDISSLTTPPMDRRAIHTEVCQYDEGRIASAVRRELAREGQVFLVHNRVFDIEELAEKVRGLVPEARVEIGHGQMHQGQLERIMRRFVLRDIDVLVCTTIIESGLDIPTANTMIIHEADRFGLAELHQLRGRVGRYKHRAFCYLLLPEDRPVSAVAAKRLKALEEFSDLGAGFQIAMRDLELCGAGNILGKAQSGPVLSVAGRGRRDAPGPARAQAQAGTRRAGVGGVHPPDVRAGRAAADGDLPAALAVPGAGAAQAVVVGPFRRVRPGARPGRGAAGPGGDSAAGRGDGNIQHSPRGSGFDLHVHGHGRGAYAVRQGRGCRTDAGPADGALAAAGVVHGPGHAAACADKTIESGRRRGIISRYL